MPFDIFNMHIFPRVNDAKVRGQRQCILASVLPFRAFTYIYNISVWLKMSVRMRYCVIFRCTVNILYIVFNHLFAEKCKRGIQKLHIQHRYLYTQIQYFNFCCE